MSKTLQEQIREAMELQQAGDFAAAKALYSQILVQAPEDPDALHLSGLASLQLGKVEDAVLLIQKAVDHVPDHPVLRNNLGLAMHKAGTLVAAAGQLQKALELQEDYAGALMNLAAVYSDLGDREGALEHGLKAVELEPERAEAWFNLGLYLLDRVELPQALEAFRRALQIQPRYAAAASSLLYTLNLALHQDPKHIAQEHRRISAAVYGQPPARPSPATQGKLRIAYLSADFRRHAVNHFFEPLLTHHDREQFHITCYSDTTQTDDVTARLQGLADHWLDCRGLEDEALAQRIRDEHIDVLIDLAGHTKGNRLGVLAQRPAALQLGWLGYPLHPGLEAVDAQLIGAYTFEKLAGTGAGRGLVPLPGVFASFQPSETAPAVAPPPALERGFVTFGSLHRLEKINEDVVACWARLLNSLPEARLLLVRDQLDPWQRRRLLGQFAAHGVDEQRLELMPGHESGGSFQEFWAEIDIYLDSFPWSGHTMACHALWAGVPVVTLQGQSHASRMVASKLVAMGRASWVADNEAGYRDIAAQLAGDTAALVTIRNELREQMADSPVMDGARFAAEFEATIRSCLAEL